MTDMDDADGPDTDPIDAQFEPAPPSADHVVTPEKTPRRPGWPALVATGVIATILGAGLGSMIGGSSSGTSATAPADAHDYEAQIAALEADQNKLGSRLAVLGADLEQAEAHFAEASPPADANTKFADDLAALAARVDLLSALPEGAGPDGEETSALSARLRSFEQSLANLRSGQSTRAEALAALTTRLTALETATSEDGSVDTSELVSLHEDISALRTELAEAVSGSTERIKLLETRQAASQSNRADNQSSGKAALALLVLESASARGVPFSDIIPALEAAGADAGRLIDLRAIAPTGAPTRAKLQDMLYGGLLAARPQTGEGTSAGETSTDDGWGWVRRTFGDSVKITRSGAPTTNRSDQTLEETAKNARALLANGNISAAMAQIDKLDNAEQVAFADWRAAADRRIRLDAALIALRASMLEQGR